MLVNIKKIPAFKRLPGQPLNACMISPRNLRFSVRSDVIEYWPKGNKTKDKDIQRFLKKNTILGQFGSDFMTAMENPSRIEYFCSNGESCAFNNNKEMEKLRNELYETNGMIEPLKAHIAEMTQKINEVIEFLSKIDKSDAKKLIEELTKSTAEITV